MLIFHFTLRSERSRTLIIILCLLRFDGCVYALKKTKRPIKGSQDENSAIKEVCAHAVLGKHKHVVRYYSAWSENDRMLIQSGRI